MKKLLLAIVILLAIATVNVNATGEVVEATLDENIQISVDNRWGQILYDEEEYDEYYEDLEREKAKTLIISGRTYLPIRAVAYSLYKDIEYDKVTKRITVVDKLRNTMQSSIIRTYQTRKKVKATKTTTSVWWNGKEIIDSSVEAYSYKNRIYVPVRKAIEAFGLKVDWDAENRRVLVFDKMKGKYVGDPKYFGYTKEDYEYILNKFGYVNEEGEIYGNPRNNYRVQTFAFTEVESSTLNKQYGIYAYEKGKLGKKYVPYEGHFAAGPNYEKRFSKRFNTRDLRWEEGTKLFEDDLLQGVVTMKLLGSCGPIETEKPFWEYSVSYALTLPIESAVIIQDAGGHTESTSTFQKNPYEHSRDSISVHIPDYSYYTVIFVDHDYVF